MDTGPISVGVGDVYHQRSQTGEQNPIKRAPEGLILLLLRSDVWQDSPQLNNRSNPIEFFFKEIGEGK